LSLGLGLASSQYYFLKIASMKIVSLISIIPFLNL